jgi:hypothetical protein
MANPVPANRRDKKYGGDKTTFKNNTPVKNLMNNDKPAVSIAPITAISIADG